MGDSLIRAIVYGARLQTATAMTRQWNRYEIEPDMYKSQAQRKILYPHAGGDISDVPTTDSNLDT